MDSRLVRSGGDVYAWTTGRRLTLLLLYMLCVHNAFPNTLYLAQIHFRPVPWQLAPEQNIGFDPAISPWVEHRRPPQMVLGEIYIPICSHCKGIRPADPRIPRKYHHSPICWVEEGDRVIFKVSTVNETVGIRLQPIRDILFPERNDGLCSEELAELALIAKACGGDRGIETRQRRSTKYNVSPSALSAIPSAPKVSWEIGIVGPLGRE